MVEPIAPAKNKTAKTDFIVFIFLTSFPANSWPSSFVTGQQGEKFPSKKILLSGIFRVDTKSPQNLNDVDSLLNFRAEEALAPLFQPDTVASAEYFEIYQRKVGLEPEKKLRLAVLRDAIGCFQNYLLARDKRRKKWFQEAQEWFNEKESKWIFSFENIL